MTPQRATDEHRETANPGLAEERTYLAWQRTGLSFAAVGALLLHLAVRIHHPAAYLPGVLGLTLGAVVLASGLFRYRNAAAAPRDEQSEPVAPFIALAALGSAVLGLAALVLIATG
jgi:uncharacterized membrane protein YidH (DUF202 family)